MSRRPPSARPTIDPRRMLPIAYVVDSGGTPVTHTWRPTSSAYRGGLGRRRTGPIAIYWQETGADPARTRVRHTVWSSTEDHGDTYPWDAKDKSQVLPVYLTRFMREASSGFLSPAFRLTPFVDAHGRLWEGHGRDLACGPAGDGVGAACACRTGAPLAEAGEWGWKSKRAERGGMGAKAWAKHQRKLRRRRI